MKKFTISFFILLCLLFNIIAATIIPLSNTHTEGFYIASDLNLQPQTTHFVQNISSTNNVYMLIFNNDSLYQSIRLEANSAKTQLLPIKPNYRVLIVGKGELFFS